MLKRKFIFALSVLAILAVGNAYATDPADTSSTTDTVGTEHTVYTAATNAGAANAPTNVASGIAGVTYVNRMVNVAGNAAQAAESHAAAAGASALSAASAAAAAQTAANNAQTTANGIADKEDKSNKVTSLSGTSTNTQYPSAKLVYDELAKKQDKLTIDSALSSTSTNPVQNKVINSALSGKEATSNKVTSLSSSSTNTQYPGAKLVYDELAKKQDTLTAGDNITIAEDGTISATDMRYTLPTASSSTKGGVKIGSGVNVTADGTISVAAPGNATLTIQRNGTSVGTFTANASSNKTINITDSDTTYSAGKNVTITDGNKINAIPVNSTTESDTLTEVFPSVSMMRAEMDDLAGDLNADVAALQETSVKHTKNTAVGTTTKPVYVASNGTATVVTGIDSSLLPAAKSDALGGVKIGTNITNNSGTISVANATATTKGVAMLGVIPAGADKSGTATIWVE